MDSLLNRNIGKIFAYNYGEGEVEIRCKKDTAEITFTEYGLCLRLKNLNVEWEVIEQIIINFILHKNNALLEDY